MSISDNKKLQLKINYCIGELILFVHFPNTQEARRRGYSENHVLVQNMKDMSAVETSIVTLPSGACLEVRHEGPSCDATVETQS